MVNIAASWEFDQVKTKGKEYMYKQQYNDMLRIIVHIYESSRAFFSSSIIQIKSVVAHKHKYDPIAISNTRMCKMFLKTCEHK